jgi:hypothetical protein
MASGYSAKRFEGNRGNRKLCHLNPFEFFDHAGKNRSGASRLMDGTYLSKRQLNSLTIHIPCSCFRLALLPDFDRCRLVFQNISESRRVRRNIALEL